MGLIFHSFTFAQGLPTFLSLKQRFEQQTGLLLDLKAIVHLPVLCSSEEVSLALGQDADKVYQLSQERKTFLLQHPSHYEEAALLRDQQLQQLRGLAHVKELQLDIIKFYAVPIGLHDNTLSFESSTVDGYGIESLRRTLFELGGREQSSSSTEGHNPAWRKLKRWEEYKWYNRPRK
ncbi:hypothetical protein [Fibrella aquatilis]|uniref:Uncharacterized protein n=1 Tax=Fibrella aquatilis TaxID=2817059 RepID=A0A939GCL9_9BACT|nr:hypothetical protein [Fibrella aquatilis]MBO0934221.1 hypothetical protein [Fibrella aquatilis]